MSTARAEGIEAAAVSDAGGRKPSTMRCGGLSLTDVTRMPMARSAAATPPVLPAAST